MPLARHLLRRCALTALAPSLLALPITALLPNLARAQDLTTLEKVKQNGTITVGYRDSSIPFSYLGGDAKPTGFGWEICGKVVEQVRKATGRPDLKLNASPVTSQNRIPLLQNGTVDIECGSTTNNSERNKAVAFAINYYYTGTRFITKLNSGVKTLDDLKGRKVVSTVGTTNYQVLRRLNQERQLNFEMLGAKDHAESLLLVETGRADAFGMDDVLLYGLRASARDPEALAIFGEPLHVEPYAIMFRKDDPAFKALVDGVLIQLIKSGEFEQLYRKWFQSPIPPRGINLNAPMSAELQANIKALSDKPTF